MNVVVPRTLPSLLKDSQEQVPINQARFVGPNGKPYFELAPIAFIERLNESSFSAITNDFCRAMKSHRLMKSTHDLITHAPRQMRFHPIVQNIDGSIFFLCRWASHSNHTEAIISDYCRKSGRRLGWYEPETQQVVGIQGLQLNQCQLVSDDVIANPTPELDQVDICAEACKILRKRTSQKIELKAWEFDDESAHSRKHMKKIHDEATALAKEYEHQLADQYGNPSKLTAKLRRAIPVNGLESCAIWQIKSKIMYLVVSHEDVGLPICIYLGIVT